MDFFASQELARRNTRWLIFWFIVSLICMIGAIYGATMVVVSVSSEGKSPFLQTGFGPAWFHPGLLGAVSAGVLSVVGAGSAYKVAALNGGGESVAAMLGGRRLPPNSSDPGERRILNVVEEMALAAGTPVPPVYVLDNEPGINAFAAGYTIDDAVIGINRGTIEQLNRDELQGVVAHEFSHILNGDMRMSIRMIGILHGIQVLALIGFYVLRASAYGGRRSSNDKGGAGAILLLAVAVIVVGYVGLFFARLIKASVSRQREYLADASAVQFTRNPDGIAGALKMIAASAQGSAVETPNAEETSHMFFASMFGSSSLAGLFSTHPPLFKRIQALDPQFDGDLKEYVRARQKRAERREAAARSSRDERSRSGFPGLGRGGAFGGMLGDRFPIDPAILIAGIGLPDNDDVAYSEVLVDRIPAMLAESSRDVFHARSVVFASLINSDRQVQQAQLETIARNEGEQTLKDTAQLLPVMRDLEPRFRLPVFEILQGTLTAMSPEQYRSFRESVDALVKADNRVDLFEFFLRHHLIVHLDRRYGLVKPPRVQFRNLDLVRREATMLLGILVRIGHEDDSEAQAALESAIQSLGVAWSVESVLADTRSYGYRDLESALEKLNAVAPKYKKAFLTAAAVAITHDGEVTVAEAELFRAMSESLDCPVPPVVATINQA